VESEEIWISEGPNLNTTKDRTFSILLLAKGKLKAMEIARGYGII